MSNETRTAIVAFAMNSAPATADDLRASVKQPPAALLTQIKSIVMDLYDDEEFRQMVLAVDNATAVGGSLQVNDFLLTQRIQAYAVTNGLRPVATANLATIKGKLAEALKALHLSRKQRLASAAEHVAHDATAYAA